MLTRVQTFRHVKQGYANIRQAILTQVPGQMLVQVDEGIASGVAALLPSFGQACGLLPSVHLRESDFYVTSLEEVANLSTDRQLGHPG